MNEITLINNRGNRTNNSTTLASIYITSLAKYNAGELVGKWFGLPLTEEELKEAVADVLEINEEYVITDAESELKIDIPAVTNVFQLNDSLQLLEKFSEDDRKIICQLADYEGELEKVLEEWTDGKNLAFKASNLEELGAYLNDKGFLPYEIPAQLEQHVDFTSIAEEWLNGGGYYDFHKVGGM